MVRQSESAAAQEEVEPLAAASPSSDLRGHGPAKVAALCLAAALAAGCATASAVGAPRPAGAPRQPHARGGDRLVSLKEAEVKEPPTIDGTSGENVSGGADATASGAEAAEEDAPRPKAEEDAADEDASIKGVFSYKYSSHGCGNWHAITIRTEQHASLQGCMGSCGRQAGCTAVNYFEEKYENAAAGSCILFNGTCENEELPQATLVEFTPEVVAKSSDSRDKFGLIARGTSCRNWERISIGGSFGGTVEECASACDAMQCSGFLFQEDEACPKLFGGYSDFAAAGCFLFKLDPADRTGRSLCDREPQSCADLYMPSAVTDEKVRQCSNRDSPSFYGQHQEDRLLLGEFFCGKMGGTYLEIGAFDGVTFSNTKFFEDAMGWSGLLIEGQPETAEKLRRSRGAIGSNNFVVDMGVCSERGTMDFTPKSTPTAGDPNHMSDDFKERWHSDFEGNALSVPCAPLSDMLSDTGVKKLDLFVLDVEGGEFEVIKTMDWTVEVCVWLVEMDGTNPEKDSNVENILVENGYVRSTSSLFWEDASDGEYHGGGQNVAFLAQDLPACLAK